VVSVRVADYDTKELIDAVKAVWVIGGSEWGVMTQTPKWAFSGKDGAEAFVRKSGGAVATWEKALSEATGERSGKKPSGKSEGRAPGKVAGGKSGCCCCGK
jgi:nitrous oxide reductase accessory protein NosL